MKLLHLLAIGLEINPAAGGSNWFASRHDDQAGQSGSVFRMLYYPNIPDADLDKQNDLRCGAHSDYGTITLLFQREGQHGLEILKDPNEDTWAPVPVNPTAEPDVPILVNVGDLLSYWTNGVLRSTVHRVILPDPKFGQDRYSIAYFCHPLDSARLEPVPSKLVQEHASISKTAHVLTAKEHLESRLKASYV